MNVKVSKPLIFDVDVNPKLVEKRLKSGIEHPAILASIEKFRIWLCPPGSYCYLVWLLSGPVPLDGYVMDKDVYVYCNPKHHDWVEATAFLIVHEVVEKCFAADLEEDKSQLFASTIAAKFFKPKRIVNSYSKVVNWLVKTGLSDNASAIFDALGMALSNYVDVSSVISNPGNFYNVAGLPTWLKKALKVYFSGSRAEKFPWRPSYFTDEDYYEAAKKFAELLDKDESTFWKLVTEGAFTDGDTLAELFKEGYAVKDLVEFLRRNLEILEEEMKKPPLY